MTAGRLQPIEHGLLFHKRLTAAPPIQLALSSGTVFTGSVSSAYHRSMIRCQCVDLL